MLCLSSAVVAAASCSFSMVSLFSICVYSLYSLKEIIPEAAIEIISVQPLLDLQGQGLGGSFVRVALFALPLAVGVLVADIPLVRLDPALLLVLGQWGVDRAALVLEPGELLAFLLDDLRVRLRGNLVEADQVVAFSRDRRHAVHALLVDASQSMDGRLEFARQAATDYVNRLRPETDRAFVVYFENNVTLAHAVSDDRESLADSIRAIRVGGMTTIHDALFYTLGELESYGDRLPGELKVQQKIIADALDEAIAKAS